NATARDGGSHQRSVARRAASDRNSGLLRGQRRLPPAQAEPRAAARGSPGTRHRPVSKLHGWRSLEGRGGRPPRRVSDRVSLPRLPRRPARPTRRPHSLRPTNRRRMDPHPIPRRSAELMSSLAHLKVKIFADGADRAGMLELYRNAVIKGFTTNPTLMRAAGITDYEAFAREILAAIPDRPISLEVFSDEF